MELRNEEHSEDDDDLLIEFGLTEEYEIKSNELMRIFRCNPELLNWNYTRDPFQWLLKVYTLTNSHFYTENKTCTLVNNEDCIIFYKKSIEYISTSNGGIYMQYK